jgi:hypothetical protein
VRFLLDTLIVLRDLLRIRVRFARVRSIDGPAATAGAAPARRSLVGPVLRSPTTRAVLVGTIGVSLILLVVARLAAPNGAVALTAWIAVLISLLALAWRADLGRERHGEPVRLGKGEMLLSAGLFAAAAALRLSWLEDVPPMMHGDTAECGLLGLRILRGEVSDVFDFSLWYKTPYLSFVPYAASFALTGLSVVGLRLPSALLGVGTVVALYVLVRVWFGARVALISTALFAVSHAAIHFSRIGLWNIQVLFYALAAFALVAVGLRRGSTRCGALCGVFSGLALYSYTAGRLVPVVAGAFLLTQLAERRTLRFAGYFAAGLVLTALPLALNYVKDPTVFELDRTASVWVLADVNRGHVENTLGTDSLQGILGEQVRRTLAGFVTLGDTSSQYGTTQPLLSPLIAVLFGLGLLLALRSLRDPRYLFLLLWLLLGLALGSVVVIDPPAYTRLIVVFPIPFVLAAVGLDACVRRVAARFRLRSAEAAIVFVLVLAQAAAFNLVGYRSFVREMQNVPREWDVLKVLDRLKDRYHYYLFTGPFLFADAPVLRLFSTGTRAVSAFTEIDVPPRLGRDSAFVVTPEFRRVGFEIATRFPSAERMEVSQNGVVKAYVYTCTLANGCRRGAS